MSGPSAASTDPFAVALEVGRELDDLGVPYHLGGSLASSIHGFARATLDADLVADLSPGQGRELARRLGDSFYASPDAMETAIDERRSFNVIHLATMFKVDVFVLKTTAFDRESFSRSRCQALGEPATEVRVATPEDTILHKLLWYEKGGRVSERQWSDLVGVIEVQGDRLDEVYLERWARELGLEPLLAAARREAKRRLEEGDR